MGSGGGSRGSKPVRLRGKADTERASDGLRTGGEGRDRHLHWRSAFTGDWRGGGARGGGGGGGPGVFPGGSSGGEGTFIPRVWERGGRERRRSGESMRGRGCHQRRRGIGSNGTTPFAGRRRWGEGSRGGRKEGRRRGWRRRWRRRRWRRARDRESLVGISTASRTRWWVRKCWRWGWKGRRPSVGGEVRGGGGGERSGEWGGRWQGRNLNVHRGSLGCEGVHRATGALVRTVMGRDVCCLTMDGFCVP